MWTLTETAPSGAQSWVPMLGAAGDRWGTPGVIFHKSLRRGVSVGKAPGRREARLPC